MLMRHGMRTQARGCQVPWCSRTRPSSWCIGHLALSHPIAGVTGNTGRSPVLEHVRAPQSGVGPLSHRTPARGPCACRVRAESQLGLRDTADLQGPSAENTEPKTYRTCFLHQDPSHLCFRREIFKGFPENTHSLCAQTYEQLVSTTATPCHSPVTLRTTHPALCGVCANSFPSSSHVAQEKAR